MRLIILGFGGVARSLARLIQLSQEDLRKRYHEELRIVGIADSRGSTADARGIDVPRVLALKEERGVVTTGASSPGSLELIEQAEADVVVELTPTNPTDGEPGLSNMRVALKNGKHVVTANKGPLAVGYSRLMRAAEKNRLQLKYSATVGGGTPVLAFGDELAKSEPVTGVEAVLNQTSNYILTQMEERRLPFDRALEEAQRLGIAERDPSLDIDGVETACEMVIIANHVLKIPSRIPDVLKIEGIRKVTPAMISHARSRRKLLRMMGTVGSNEVAVGLVELDENDPLAIKGARDATRYICRHSGPKLIGSLAGSPMDTSSGIMRDIIDIVLTVRDGSR
jgi:homoserine dehydrogenase